MFIYLTNSEKREGWKEDGSKSGDGGGRELEGTAGGGLDRRDVEGMGVEEAGRIPGSGRRDDL